jgi:hypothetical protein
MIALPANKPIIVVKNEKDADQFIADCQKIYTVNNDLGTSFCGIDFEFNMNWKKKERYIALMQIIFIFNDSSYYDAQDIKPIYILNPLKLNPEHMKKFIKYILCSRVTKIFHGSDSLDFPYTYRSILGENKKKFIKFINHSVDTRFLCEISKRMMVRAGMIPVTDKKCSIYNALFDHNVVDRQKFDQLTQISSKINYNKDWIVDKLKPEQLVYGAYDVAYLYDLLHTITKNIRTSSSIRQTSLDTDSDDEIIPDTAFRARISGCIVSMVTRLYRFHTINRMGLTLISSRCKALVDHYKINRDRMNVIDQKIMERFVTKIIIKEPWPGTGPGTGTGTDPGVELDVMVEDLLSIDTIRKSILNCLRVYEINHGTDPETADRYFENSNAFKKMKGRESILELINIIKNIKDLQQANIKCGT